MTLFQTEDRAKLKREKSQEAIALAMQNRWKEAAELNQEVLRLFPDDVEAYNRLGKALSELGNFSEARNAFRRALELAPNNVIAKKNIDRLAHVQDAPSIAQETRTATPHVFIEESGKTKVTKLVNGAPKEVLARVAPGDTLVLKATAHGVDVESCRGDRLGQFDPKLGLRLARLINGGNRYEAAITSVKNGETMVIIREVYRHPSQQGICSFPSRGEDGYHSYMRGTMLSYYVEDEEEEGGASWGLESPGLFSDVDSGDVDSSEGGVDLGKRPTSGEYEKGDDEDEEDEEEV